MLVDEKNELWRERVRDGDSRYPNVRGISGQGGDFYDVLRVTSGGFWRPLRSTEKA